ncbi:MAG: methylisocitrate lyase [Legionellales bacterium]|jgi:methylisocitrate lyase
MSFLKTQEKPLQIVGVINAYCAILAEKSGFEALYLSGAGVANASYGIPDIGLTTLNQVLIDIERITQVTSLPLLVDADTGFEDITQTVQSIEAAGAAGLHLEDQIEQKRCGQLDGKQLVKTQEMVERIQKATCARENKNFMIMARTDAITVEGLEAAVLRAKAYQDAGADAIFVEAALRLEDYGLFKQALDIPILANITEFGKTPLFSVEELKQVNVDMILYPLSAFRAMNQAALAVYQTIKKQGTQRECLGDMQTREQLYEYLNYDAKK